MNLPTPPEAGKRDHPSNGPNAKTHCFYCRQLLGQHADDCVCVTRSVVVELKIRYIVEVPQDRSAEDIESHRNLGSFCLANDIHQLEEEANLEPGLCNICSRAEVRYVREATEEDHEQMPFKQSEH